jgi:tripartite-type tricarboxylate transporter receptor subunit TctC
MQSRIVCAAAAAVVAAFSAGSALAQGYPSKPVRIIAPYPPGGGADAAARIIGQGLTENTRQQFIVDNRAGASGQIGTALAAQATPDGYTLLLGNVGPNAILPASGIKLAYDPLADFIPLSLVAVSEYALTVHPSLPVKSVKDLVTLAKAKPDEIGFGSTGLGGGPHLAGELLNQLTGIRLLHVPYKGGGPVMSALLSGEVSVSFSTLPTVLPFRSNGKLRIVAVTGARRSPFAKDVPTVAETVPGYEVTQWYGLLAPAKTDAAIVSQLQGEIARAVARDSVKKQFAHSGAIATATTSTAFRQLIEAEIAKWKKVFASGSIQLD